MQETSLQLLPKAREEGGCDFAQDTTIAAKVRSVVYAAIAEKEINQQRRRALKAIFVQDVISATLSHCVLTLEEYVLHTPKLWTTSRWVCVTIRRRVLKLRLNELTKHPVKSISLWATHIIRAGWCSQIWPKKRLICWCSHGTDMLRYGTSTTGLPRDMQQEYFDEKQQKKQILGWKYGRSPDGSLYCILNL